MKIMESKTFLSVLPKTKERPKNTAENGVQMSLTVTELKLTAHITMMIAHKKILTIVSRL